MDCSRKRESTKAAIEIATFKLEVTQMRNHNSYPTLIG